MFLPSMVSVQLRVHHGSVTWELETISKSIQGAIVDLIENFDMDTVNSLVVRSKSQVRFFR